MLVLTQILTDDTDDTDVDDAFLEKDNIYTANDNEDVDNAMVEDGYYFRNRRKECPPGEECP